MRSRYPSLLALITIVPVIISCTNQPSSSDATGEKTESTNMTIIDYNPGPDWNLVWSDEFEGEKLNPENWNRQVEPAGRFNEEWQRYTSSEDNAYIEDNMLVIKAIHEGKKHGMNEYTSARLNTAGKQTWKFGKIVSRMKLPQGMGIWPAFWMLGANIDENGGDTPWPQCGEIDIHELYGFRDDAVIEANLHYADSAGKHAQMGAVDYKLKEGIFADDFHVFELEWDQDYVIWRLDGEEFASLDISGDQYSEFRKEFFILMNIAVGGSFSGRPDETTPFPQHMYVDWVRVYQKA